MSHASDLREACSRYYDEAITVENDVANRAGDRLAATVEQIADRMEAEGRDTAGPVIQVRSRRPMWRL
jgi:hypothetical protein